MKKLDVRLRFCLILTGPECCSPLADHPSMLFYVWTHLPASEPAEENTDLWVNGSMVETQTVCTSELSDFYFFIVTLFFVWCIGSWQNIMWTYKNLLFTIVTISLYNLIAKIWQPRHFCKQKITDVLTCGSLFYDLQDQICQIIVELIIDFIGHGSPIWQEFLLINTFRLTIYFYIEMNKNKVLYCF